MAGLDGLGRVFATALTPLAEDAVLHRTVLVDTGAGGVGATGTDTPIKLLVESMSAQDRIGLPRTAVRLVVLGIDVVIGLDDSVSVGGTTYRVIAVDTLPARAGLTITGVPA